MDFDQRAGTMYVKQSEWVEWEDASVCKPNDGELVLVCNEGEPAYDLETYWDGLGWGNKLEGFRLEQDAPTHWMRIPLPLPKDVATPSSGGTQGVQSKHVASTEQDSEPGVQSGDVASTDSEPMDPASLALQERLGRQVASVLVRLNTPDEAMIPMACLTQSISNMLIAIKTEDADAVVHAANDARKSMEVLQDDGISSLVAACAATTCVLAEMDDMQPDTRRCVACAIRSTMTGEPPICEPKTMPDPSTKSTMLN